jgi:hypothetical protein
MRRHAISPRRRAGGPGRRLALYPDRAGDERVSAFGRYAGYTPALYDGSVRRSDYLALRTASGLPTT